MKLGTIILSTSLTLLMLTGCANDTNETAPSDISESSSVAESTETPAASLDSTGSEDSELEDSSAATDQMESTVSESNASSGEQEESSDLSQYSSEEIEYARIWLQLGPNQEIDELYVNHIPAGELVNPLDETSAVYPEDVIQLAGGRLLDGSVTYSGNGDGTINIYNVPLRWESNTSPEADDNFMKEYTEELVENTELVYVEPASGEEIEQLIEKLQIPTDD